jgi:hypothetical protein
MMRISIERIVIEGAQPPPEQAEMFRETLRRQISVLLAQPGATLEPRGAPWRDGGELTAASSGDLSRVIAEGVVRTLGGQT